MRNGFKIYDTHAHLGTAVHSGRVMPAESLLAIMDKHGVDRSLAIPYPTVPSEAAAHDEIAAAVRAYPGRFRGAACLHPFAQPREKVVAEMKRCRLELGLSVLKLQPQYQPLHPFAARNAWYWEAAVQLGMTMVIHTGAGAPFALPSLYIPVAQRYPELPIILGHCGSSSYVQEAIVAAMTCPNIFLELSTLMPNHVMEVLQYVPTSRLMAGSDLPDCIEAEFVKIEALEISDDDKRAILWETGERVLG